jgi:hypothetical protein
VRNMSFIKIRRASNESLSFVKIVNFMVSYKMMSLEDASRLHLTLMSGEEIIIRLPETMASQLANELDFLGWKYELTR